MNIFQVLSQGKSRLHEPSMSAMLGYLIDSNKDHGLGDVFTREFLSLLSRERFREQLDSEFIEAAVSLEEPYTLNGQRREIDIQVSILDQEKNEIHRLIIENKIKVGAANPKQLQDYYDAILEDDPDIKNLSVVFVTPNQENQNLHAEFENLKITTTTHDKHWVKWTHPESSIVGALKRLLTMELSGEINPINEYMRHTLKAFIRHCQLTTERKERQKMRINEDLGEITHEVSIMIDNHIYRLIRRESTQIQLINEDTEEKEPARGLLFRFIDQNALPIIYKGLNTRQTGKRILDQLKKRPELMVKDYSSSKE